MAYKKLTTLQNEFIRETYIAMSLNKIPHEIKKPDGFNDESLENYNDYYLSIESQGMGIREYFIGESEIYRTIILGRYR